MNIDQQTSPTASTLPTPPVAATTTPTTRLASIDAYRGFVMFLLLAEVLHFAVVARARPESGFWEFLAFNQKHAEWVGCSLHDLIQPSFSFLVGVALVFSVASRHARGQPKMQSTVHALWRSLLLILLGVFLRSVSKSQTYWTFEDTLTQIGLGYPFLFLLALRSRRTQWVALAVILTGYWAAWALYPVSSAAGHLNSAAWTHDATGFAAHWNKNANLGAAFDRWFLNLFPRSEPFVANSGGYLTLSFIPTLGTMILGLLAGGWLRDPTPSRAKVILFLVAGAIAIGLALLLHVLGVCPLVKRIWTPTWTIFSGGCCFLMLGAFYATTDAVGWKRWSFPLRVIGMNSIAAYLISWLMHKPVAHSLEIHLPASVFTMFGPDFTLLVNGVLVLLLYWLFLFWMYQRRLFLKL